MGAKGDTIELALGINVLNATGVGEFGISVDGPVTSPVSQRFLLDKGIPAGQQSLGVKLTVQDDESGDFPVIWSPGTYEVKFEVCQGECHSKHPHSKFFGMKAGNFTVTAGKARIHSPRIPEASTNALCSPCVQLGGQSLNLLLNYILNAGVVGGCGKLCNNLQSKGARTACDLVCGAVGIKAFITALNHTDL